MINLEYKYGYEWYQKNDIWVKGYFFDENAIYYKNEKLLEYFEGVNTYEEFKIKLQSANGLFSVVIKIGNSHLISVDKLRTFPLFYYIHNNKLIISDNSFWIKDKYNLNISEESQEEFKIAGYTTDNTTLIKDIFQIEASEAILFDNDANIKEKSFFYSYMTKDVFSCEYDKLSQDFLAILDKSTKRLIKTLNNQTVVIPLSGGYDSRLVAALLKKHNYENVICFTYGNADSFEVSISEKVAKSLGYEWHFIEYTEELIGNYTQNDDFVEYYKFAFNNTACFLLQDYFAVRYLTDNKLIPKDSIIITGHSGDLLAGSQISSKIRYSSDEKKMKELIYEHTYKLAKVKNKKTYLNKINIDIDSGYSYSIVDNYFINRKIARFIINSHRIYEFFGYEHRLPLWDDELTEFFRRVPYEYKQYPYLYEEVLLNTLFKDYNIDIIPQDKIRRDDKKAKIKSIIKQYTPSFVIKLREKLIFEDINNISFMTKPMEPINDIEVDKNNIDAVIVNWIIQEESKSSLCEK